MYKQCSLFDANLPLNQSQDLHGGIATKVCKTCHKRKPDNEFTKADGRHRATRNRCKECTNIQNNIRNTLKKIHPEPAAGNCQICGQYTSEWVLDHCHKNLSFRGYICRSCNSGIGLLHDDPDTLKRAFIYLTNETKTNNNTA